MSKTKTTVKSFVKQFVSYLQGDSNQVVAEKNWRKATAGFNSQIASIRERILVQEDIVEAAKEDLDGARVHFGQPIIDTVKYVQNIFDAKATLKEAEEDLTELQETLTDLQTEVDLLNTEVEDTL